MLSIVIVIVIGALAFAAINFGIVRKMSPGTAEMEEISDAIRLGSDAFIRHQYGVVFRVSLCVALLLGLVVSWYTGVTFLLGMLMSGSAGWIGMKIATISNVRVSNVARETGDIGRTLKVAFRGGSVMGLCVGGFALLGLVIVYGIFGRYMGQTSLDGLAMKTNWLGIHFIPFTMSLSGYALGCSIIAMFGRVGGGIFTKAADMGADLVGKTEAHIPEDDPRNPATIADNVGDNVGDVAGLGADLLESYVGALISSVILAICLFYTTQDAGANTVHFELVERLILYPLGFAGIGIVSCMVGIIYLLARKTSDNPHRELNLSTLVSALLTILGTGFFTASYFRGQATEAIGFNFGILSPWIAAVAGNLAGIAIGQLAEVYTSFDYRATRKLAEASCEGYALNITQGMAGGMKSVFFPVVIMALATIIANAVAGLYGVSMAAIGMLSYVVATVSVDTFGPIADNAGGISEMSKLDPKVRRITDHLDAVGNTTAAIGKGFAIGSAALAALSLFASYLYAQASPDDTQGYALSLNFIDIMTLTGGLVGAALPFLFSGILIEAVSKVARQMVQEVRRQFRDIPGILTGESKPDYITCISISSAGALAEMKLPAILSIAAPLVGGFLLGPKFVGGLLVGTTLSAVTLALYTANAGGAWDNAKKFIESGKHGGKGSDAHSASVVGDTVGDPLKDTVGPSLDILIKIMAVVSLIFVSVFQKYNLVDWFTSLNK